MRILLAEDEPGTRHLLKSLLLKWHYQVVVAQDGSEAWRLLQQEDAPMLAILDWMMPGLDGIQVCREVRKLGRRSYTYILLLTARKRKQDIVAGMEAGADDYLSKPFDAAELKARLRAGQRVIDLQEKLLSQASYDPLTGVWNRRVILEILETEVARARRALMPLAVAMIDLDHFKRINDTYGHMTGDDVLRHAVQRMLATVRAYDSVGRYGGEEFLIILPGCSLNDAPKQGERLRVAVSAQPTQTRQGGIPLTASIGIAVAAKPAQADGDSLLAAADSAMYAAKTAGRNRVELVAVSGPRAAKAS